jgi:hypothetical protein
MLRMRWLLLTARALLSLVLELVSLLADLTRGHPRVVAVKLGLGGLLLSLTGCDGCRLVPPPTCYVGVDSRHDSIPDDTAWYRGPTLIGAVTYGYDPDGWEYLVELVGWGEAVELQIHGEDGGVVWEEAHALINTEYGADRSWDHWALELALATDAQAQEAGVSTLYAPNDATDATMTWRALAYEHGLVVDCAVWGRDPAVFDDLDCHEVVVY